MWYRIRYILSILPSYVKSLEYLIFNAAVGAEANMRHGKPAWEVRKRGIVAMGAGIAGVGKKGESAS